MEGRMMIRSDVSKPELIAALWRRRFGQPPPIVAEPEVMLRVLRSCAPVRPAAQPRSWVED
jgi:hypothetical protein